VTKRRLDQFLDRLINVGSRCDHHGVFATGFGIEVHGRLPTLEHVSRVNGAGEHDHVNTRVGDKMGSPPHCPECTQVARDVVGHRPRVIGQLE